MKREVEEENDEFDYRYRDERRALCMHLYALALNNKEKHVLEQSTDDDDDDEGVSQ